MRRFPLILPPLVGLALFGCPGKTPRIEEPPVTEAPDGGGSTAQDGGGQVTPVDHCTLGEASCSAWNQRRSCVATAEGNRLVEQPCATGEGCVDGACAPARCADECTIGATDGSRTCALFDVEAQSWVALDPAGSMHDRARAYAARLWRDAFRHTGIGHPRYADPGTWEQVVSLSGLGDSALHTGEYFASEALRLMATGAPDARAHVRKGVEALHTLMNVSGYPGVLARHAVPADAPDLALLEYDCAHYSHHCGVPYAGRLWNYRGHVSRDMYQGVMLALGLSYDALSASDEPARELIREDVVRFVEELMKERTVKLKLEYNGTAFPAATVRIRFGVIVENELVDGALYLKYDGGNGSWRGFQEFIPNLADVTKQIVGPLSPARIPRDGSAIMLSSFFRLALHVTEGVPAYATRRAAIETFFRSNTGLGGNIQDWMAIAAEASFGGEGSDGCGAGYYANNLSMQPLYNWARLETDSAIRDFALDLLEQKAWPAFAPTKNVFFIFLAQGLSRDRDAAGIQGAATQLAGFGPPPRARLAVDLRSDPRYADRQPDCADQLVHTQAVDVADRIPDEFIWQNNPWGLYFGGDPAQTTAGGDYLVAYWLGRHHDFIPDDRPKTCARWR